MEDSSPFAAQKVLFRAYDIRGAQSYFTQSFVQALAHSFAKLYINQPQDPKDHTQEPLTASINAHITTVIIGYDVRYGSDSIAQTLAEVLQASGLRVINLGLVTTPMAAFWAQQYEGHGIMVTASHSSKETLGIKWLVNNTSPSYLEIQALYQHLADYKLGAMSDNSQLDPQKQPAHIMDNSVSYSMSEDNSDDTQSTAVVSLPADVIASTYIDSIIEVIQAIHSDDKLICARHYAASSQSSALSRLLRPTFNLDTKLDLTLVIDCLNGATSNIAQPLFARFCRRVIMLNDDPDGSFPTGNPDPTEPNRLAELQQTVIVNEADMGLAFDGDGDRLMIVDNSGKVVTPDHLLYLLAQVAITERQPSKDTHDTSDDTADTGTALIAPPVLFDVKCSHHLAKLLADLGAQPIMTKTGSSLLRQQLQTDQQQAIFAGELSGHFIFNDGYFIVYDDAMYAGIRLLHWLTFTATATQSDKIMLTSNVWGELRSVLPPYNLTDITRHLPALISTADHYLPLAELKPCQISTLGHLIAYCQYLQRLALEITPISSSTLTEELAACDCLYNQSGHSRPSIYEISSRQARQLLPIGTEISLIDGIRLDFANGFGVVRESNTSHSLTVRFAGDSLADLKEVQARFVALCALFDHRLAEQIAAIKPE